MESLQDELDIITIPAGTRLHLWDHGDITDAHFISSGDLNVLVRRGHGSMYRMLQEYVDASTNQLVNGIKHLPLVRDVLHPDTKIEQAIDSITAAYRNHVDAIMMAYTKDGKIGLLFIQEGSDVPVQTLLSYQHGDIWM